MVCKKVRGERGRVTERIIWGGGGGEGRRDGQDRDGEGSNHADLYTQIDILHTYSQIERQTDILHAYTQIDRQTFYIHTHR